MLRVLVPIGLLLWAGITLLLHELRWFSRTSLSERLAPYVPGALGTSRRVGLLSVESFGEAVGPLARTIGERLSRIFGVSEDLERRLTRIHSDLDVTAFRVRQVAWGLAGLGGGTMLVVALQASESVDLPVPMMLLFILGGPLLAFLVMEQQVAGASDRWKRALYLELPIISEQIGMLLGSGYSLMAAIERVSRRGQGATSQDLRRVLRRIRQGTDETTALREWADLSNVEAVERFVSVLALNREATDLGRLIAEEARKIRRDVHRELIETMEKRSQQVWIPVTVATLVPGVIFIAIPFTQALQGLNL